MGATPIYALPYPAATDPADVPTDMQELADRIETVVGPGSASGQVPVWDNAAKKWTAGIASGGELGFAVTATVLNTSAGAGAPATFIALASIVYPGTPVVMDFSCPWASHSVAGAAISFTLWDDTAATVVGRFAILNPPTAGQAFGPLSFRYRFTPPAGARVYSWRVHTSAATASVGCGSGGATNTEVQALMRVAKA